MKEKEIIDIVEERFKTLEKLCPEILKKFDVDDIHDFRVEVKKLRAFLRLINIKKEDDEPTIPKLLKTFYGHIGIVRNIHILKHDLFKYIDAHTAEIPEGYLELMDNEENYWRKQADATMENKNFIDVKDKILKALPGKLEKPRIEKFIENKLAELKELLEDLTADNKMHSIRKILKDIQYIQRYIQDYTKLPKSIADETKLKAFTSMLGDFMDKYIELEFLESKWINKVKAEKEMLLLLAVKSKWDIEKHMNRKKIIRRLSSLKKQLHETEVATG